MSAPTWATVIGVLMMLFAGCGACSSVQNTRFSDNLEKQGDMLEKITQSMDDDIETAEGDTTEVSSTIDSSDSEVGTLRDDRLESEETKRVKEMFGSMFSFSEETKMWIERFGYIRLFGAIVYFLGGLFLLIPKPFSIRLAYGALILSIVISLAQWFVLSGDGAGIMKYATGAGAIFGIVIDLVFMVIIYASDKYVYSPDEIYQE